MLLQIKDMKHIEQVFVLMPGSYLRGGTWGRWGAQESKLYFFYEGHPISSDNNPIKQNLFL